MKINQYIEASGVWAAPDRNFKTLMLDLNENHFLTDFLDDFIANEMNVLSLSTYPNYGPLMDALSEYCQVPTDHLLIANGADQAIDLLIRLLFTAGDRVVVPSPVFSFYYQTLDVNGIVTKVIEFGTVNRQFFFPFEKTLAALDDADGLILCNPNNPLGTEIDTLQLQALVQRCAARDIPVIVDEAYFEYLGRSCYDAMDTVEQLIVIRSFSKYFGLAGLRLGYILASPTIIRQLQKIRGPWDVNHLAVNAALYCLRNIDQLQQYHALLQKSKHALLAICAQAGIDAYDTKSNFILIRDQSGKLLSAFRSAGILVSDCSAYPHSAGIIRQMLRLAVPPMADVARVGAVIEESRLSIHYQALHHIEALATP
ncbi:MULTISPECIES: histidinol-phosphate transaminase [unclassified Undibacterium]|uniref:pyridoxal phosphate-dependent aminotransferase n=1 Tax=unclassified Undibacterium TaxID=2630295 RepID=UPI002AC8BE35|nr:MULTISPECIES: histidinol-phosphate transaminase [unclassified Undibacterium]MEB0140486.1 histidinol-phosphate transaminase [Undibacterium sp. CCC2.1]MEB0173729.1 histidinol-phosphate transaminase [Undibacterium sp. CCC1.1]MEB0177729.1 histidinol-phosphate transaminase [Undibacterium sp. CCC3.4]MEB0217431.1 histidinol-phosphate transaminase [Undibacterium sp. 5I2]WPX44616.1 histidinol-phosphate transaminase [Undibacterium sp. CCC3.4]